MGEARVFDPDAPSLGIFWSDMTRAGARDVICGDR
jgi:hypothetical protein